MWNMRFLDYTLYTLENKSSDINPNKIRMHCAPTHSLSNVHFLLFSIG
jgi:hypothetical protein